MSSLSLTIVRVSGGCGYHRLGENHGKLLQECLSTSKVDVVTLLYENKKVMRALHTIQGRLDAIGFLDENDLGEWIPHRESAQSGGSNALGTGSIQSGNRGGLGG